MEDNEDFVQKEDRLDAIARFENMLNEKTNSYFDVVELEWIIDYYIEVSDLQRALTASNFADRLHPANFNIQLKKAIVLIDQHRFEEAKKILDSLAFYQILEYEIDAAYIRLHLSMENFDKASEESQKFIEKSNESSIDFLVELADLNYNYFQFSNSEKLLKRAYELDNEDIEVLFRLAEHIIRFGNVESSISLYQDFLDRNPFSELVWYNLGNSYSVLERVDEALDAYDFALAIDEDLGMAVYAKGNTYFQAEDFKSALACFHDYLKLNEDPAQAYFQIGLCHERLNELDLAMEHFQKAIDELAIFAESYFMMSSILYNQDELERALTYINEAIVIEELNSEYHFLKGKIFLKQDNYEEAAKSFTRATLEDTTDTESWFNLAYCLVMLNQTEKAIFEITKGIESNPDDPDLYYHLSAVWFKMGNHSTAIRHFSKAYYLNPDLKEDLFDYYPELGDLEEIKDFIRENE